jgi:ABC-type Co2+ transport system permease subunit
MLNSDDVQLLPPIDLEAQAIRVRVASMCWPLLLMIAGGIGLIVFWSEDAHAVQSLLLVEVSVLGIITIIGCAFMRCSEQMSSAWTLSLALLAAALLGITSASIYRAAILPHEFFTYAIFTITLGIASIILGLHILVVYFECQCVVRPLMRCLRACC